jgi:alpha-D-ribose 1-methylphosphonate 5-triphosphate synthase subunit PhnG
VRLESGAIGHAYVLGRDARQAELAAVLDAALQEDTGLQPVIDKLAASQAARREKTAAKAAATKVEFFTMSTMRT